MTNYYSLAKKHAGLSFNPEIGYKIDKQLKTNITKLLLERFTQISILDNYTYEKEIYKDKKSNNTTISLFVDNGKHIYEDYNYTITTCNNIITSIYCKHFKTFLPIETYNKCYYKQIFLY